MKLLSVMFVLFFSFNSSALQSLQTDDFKVVDQKIRELVQQYGKDQVLVAYDIDNTLMAMDVDLGTDQWFDWQSELVTQHPEGHPDQVAKDIGGLLKILAQLYGIGHMRLTQAELPAIYEQLGKDGIKQMLLTSRSGEVRDSTEREIVRNGIKVWDASRANVTISRAPYDLNDLGKSCLVEEDKARFRLSAPRQVSFGHNIMMTGGQHKGMALRTWLCRNKKIYKAIVFVDDRQKNVDDVTAAYGADPKTELVTFRYTREDARVKNFIDSDKTKVKSDWEDVRAVLSTIFRSVE